VTVVFGPRVRRTPVERPDRPGPDRFPGYDVREQLDHWDSVTAGVVLRRLGPPPDLRFFSVPEQPTVEALFDQLLDQRDDPKVPVLQLVDSRLCEAQTDGWRHEEMPEDGDSWHVTLHFLAVDATEAFGRRFHDCDDDQQRRLLDDVQGAATWHDLPARWVWSLWTRYAAAAFYSHPWAWNEIGFGGPAYPRGYKNIGVDKREPWEVRDHAPQDPTREVR
jgi:hypothetical protein